MNNGSVRKRMEELSRVCSTGLVVLTRHGWDSLQVGRVWYRAAAAVSGMSLFFLVPQVLIPMLRNRHFKDRTRLCNTPSGGQNTSARETANDGRPLVFI